MLVLLLIAPVIYSRFYKIVGDLNFVGIFKDFVVGTARSATFTDMKTSLKNRFKIKFQKKIDRFL